MILHFALSISSLHITPTPHMTRAHVPSQVTSESQSSGDGVETRYERRRGLKTRFCDANSTKYRAAIDVQ
jgi:hypothetical protein